MRHWLRVFALAIATGAWADCAIHPNAWNASPGILQAYADGERWHSEAYYGIRGATKDSEGLLNRDGWIMVRMPVSPYFLPYADSDVRVITGWIYPKEVGEAVHSGVDFARSDEAAFQVRATADGWVVWVGRHEGTGPAVIIDHGGLRSLYHLHQGSVDVREGEFVEAKQTIGRAAPYLHFAVAAPAERVEKSSPVFGLIEPQALWTLLDPFGIYGGEESLGCYNNDDGIRETPQHASLFAPSPPDFVDLEESKFATTYRYYTRFKWHPWTLSISTQGGRWLVSGSFHQETKAPPAIALFRSVDQLEDDIKRKASQGFQLGQLSGVVNGGGDSRFAELFWVARPFVTKQWMTPGSFLEEFQAQIKNEWVLTQYLPQMYGAELRITATWTKLDPFRDQAAFYGLTEQEFQQKNQELESLNFDLVDLFRFRNADGASRIGGLWHSRIESTSFRNTLAVAPEALAETVARAKRSGYGVWRLHRHESGIDLVLMQGLGIAKPAVPVAAQPTFDRAVATQKLVGDLRAPHAPDPKPPVTFVTTPSTLPIRIEGEHLVGEVYLSEGSVIAGDMTPFKRDWSNDGALLWIDANPGARMTLKLEAPHSGNFGLKVRYTVGDNFGIFRHELYGRALGPDLDGCGENIAPGEVVDLGQIRLAKGRNDLMLVIRGKSECSKGFVVGIDYYELTPLP